MPTKHFINTSFAYLPNSPLPYIFSLNVALIETPIEAKKQRKMPLEEFCLLAQLFLSLEGVSAQCNQEYFHAPTSHTSTIARFRIFSPKPLMKRYLKTSPSSRQPPSMWHLIHSIEETSTPLRLLQAKKRTHLLLDRRRPLH